MKFYLKLDSEGDSCLLSEYWLQNLYYKKGQISIQQMNTISNQAVLYINDFKSLYAQGEAQVAAGGKLWYLTHNNNTEC